MKKHFNILFRRMLIVWLVCLSIISNTKKVSASEIEKIKISAESTEAEIYQTKLTIPLKIYYEPNSALLNDNTYVSYHLSNKDGSDLQYENERIKIQPNDIGVTEVEIMVDLSGVSRSHLKKGILISFDIVDEANAYWFSENTNIELVNEQITFKDNYMKRVAQEYYTVVTSHPIIFSVNILCLLCFAVMYKLIKKYEIL